VVGRQNTAGITSRTVSLSVMRNLGPGDGLGSLIALGLWSRVRVNSQKRQFHQASEAIVRPRGGQHHPGDPSIRDAISEFQIGSNMKQKLYKL